MLGTNDAIYSDGEKYRPLLAAFKLMQLEHLGPSIKQVLVLGTGLASVINILDKMGLHPQCTLVDIDPVVLGWAQEFVPTSSSGNVQWIHRDAFQFIETDSHKYDLIIVDIFLGRKVPAKVLSPEFLAQCKEHLQAPGWLVLNYMVQSLDEENDVTSRLEKVFAQIRVIRFGFNRVFVIKV